MQQTADASLRKSNPHLPPLTDLPKPQELEGRNVSPRISKNILSISEAVMDILLNVKEESVKKLNYIVDKGGAKPVPEETIYKVIEENGIPNLNAILQGQAPVPQNIQIAPGGASANTLRGLAAIPEKTWGYTFMGRIGNDEMGIAFQKSLKDRGIKHILLTSHTITTLCLCLITPDKERTMLCCSGESTAVPPESLESSSFDNLGHLHMDGYFVLTNLETAEKAMQRALDAEATISFDLANFCLVENHKETVERLIRSYSTVLFANEIEASKLTGKESPEEAAKEIATMCRIAVVSVGEKGAWVSSNGTTFHCEAIRVEKIEDTTGAGDMFASGFLYKWLKGADLQECARFGCLLGSEVIQIKGSQIPEEKWDTIREILNS